MCILLPKVFIMLQNYYLALLHKIWITHKKLHTIFENNSDYKQFYEDISTSSLSTYWFTEKQIQFILDEKVKHNISDIKNTLESRDAYIISIKDKNYPEYLKQIPNVPYLLYIRWKLDNSPKFAVVWSRNITSYWNKAITDIVWDISKYFTIVSWWAAWCDSKAHEIAIKNKNKTISIIWTGIDIDYPAYNKKLFENIIETWWTIISIFPLWEIWNPYNFPIRNEIVAGLSVWVLVIEAKIKSWTLITANLALDLWKDLFAIPWDYNKISSEWCNMLIKKWMAKLTTCSQDVLIEYNIDLDKSIQKANIIFEDELEEQIYNYLITESLTIDQLITKLWITSTSISLKLSMLEIKNIIKKSNWWKYELI